MSAAPKSKLRRGTRLGGYVLDRHIGSGGMADVYEARHATLKKRFAVKVLRQERLESAESRERFLREAEHTSRIHHPNIVTVIDVGEADALVYLVMELLSGEPLGNFLAAHGAQSVEWAADAMLGVCAGVQAAHDEGIVHRDLKPDNVFLTRTPGGHLQPKVLDFGVSKALADDVPSLTMTTSILGTPYYMSPEQATGAKNADERSDQYAIGVMLYECTLGRRPHRRHGANFLKLMHAIAAGRFDMPRSVDPALSVEFEQLLLKVMATNPAERFDSVRELARELLEFASERARLLWEPVFSGTAEPPLTQSIVSALESQDTIIGDSTANAHTLANAPVLVDSAVSESGVVAATSMDAADPLSSTDDALGSTHVASGTPQKSGTVLRIRARPEDAERHERASESDRDDTAERLSITRADTLQSTVGTGRKLARSKRMHWLIAAGVVALLAVGIVLVSRLDVATDAAATSAERYPVVLRVSPESARIELDGQPVGIGTLRSELPRDGRVHRIRVSADGYVPQTVSFRDAPPPATLALERSPEAPAPARAGKGSSAGPGPKGSPSSKPAAPKRDDAPPAPGSSEAPAPTSASAAPPVVPTNPDTDNIDPWAQ